jgi:hypothetical protein
MEHSLLKSAAWVIGVGSLLFAVAAFLPYSRIFIEQDPVKRMAIIIEMKKMWNAGQVLFGLGAIVTVIGLAIFLFGFKEITARGLSWVSVIILGTGAILWSWHVTERLISPEQFARGTNTPYLFAIYSVLTQAGLFLLGVILFKTAMANWVSWMFMTGSVLLFILMVILKDMPPFVYYILTLILSVVLFIG